MKTEKSICWGIMGCGTIAHLFAEGLSTIPNAVLKGVASRSLGKAKDFSQKHSAEKHFGSYEELAADPDIDVIYIATPHVAHCANTLLCLQHKKAVLCEKPFAMNTAQVQKMIAEAKTQHVFLMEAMWTYFLPHYKYVLALVNSGTMGKITNLKADFGFKGSSDPNGRLLNKKLGGGSLLDIGIYPIFVALTLLGKPKHINAEARFNSTGVDENCKMEFLYSENVSAHLYSDITKQTPTEIQITLEKGTILVHGCFHEPSSVTVTKEGKEELVEFPESSNGYNYEAMHVQEMLYANRQESTIMTYNTSLELIALLDQVSEKIGLTYDAV